MFDPESASEEINETLERLQAVRDQGIIQRTPMTQGSRHRQAFWLSTLST